MSGKILVIGATGNVGAPLVAELLRRGEKVKAASRNAGARFPSGAEAGPARSLRSHYAGTGTRQASTVSMRFRRRAASIR